MSTRTIEIHAPDDGRVLYTLLFEYVQDSRKLYTNTKDEPNLFLVRGVVKLNVIDAVDKYIGWGEAHCYRKDKWDPKKGERIALGRALKVHSNPLQKPARAMIWEQYFTARPIVEPETARQKRKREARAKMEAASKAAAERRSVAQLERRQKIAKVMLGLEKLGEHNYDIGEQL